MKNNMIKAGAALLVLLIFNVSVFAQRGHRNDVRRADRLAEMEKELDLTTTQQEQLDALRADFREKAKAIRADDSLERSKKGEAMKNLRSEQKTALEKILTPEQQATLEKKRAEAKEKRKANRETRSVLKEELRAYREANVIPVLQQQRAKLEAKITAVDRTKIAELREKMEEKQKEFKMNRQAGKRGGARSPRKKGGSTYKEELRALVEKYDSEIAALYKEIAPQHEQWKKEQKAIVQKHLNSQQQEKAKERMNQRKKRRAEKHPVRKATFLLMEGK